MHDSDLEDQSKRQFHDDGILDDQSEIAFQNDNGTLKNQLKVTDDIVVAVLVRHDNNHRIIEDIYRKTHMGIRQSGIEGDSYVVDLQVVKVVFESLKSDYLSVLSDID